MVGLQIPPNRCQWLLTNIIEKGKPDYGLGGLIKSTVMEKAGKRIGFIGIGEKDWTDTFRNIEVEVEYQNYKETAAKYV
jgi:2',3'-cyclic-nucleotide 2'-phosphodiesterase (5'-nucleotidase family)